MCNVIGAFGFIWGVGWMVYSFACPNALAGIHVALISLPGWMAVATALIIDSLRTQASRIIIELK